MNAKIILFVNANVISFVTTLQSKRIHKCNCNRISRHTDPMCNIIRILRTRLQQQTQLAYPPPCSPAFWFFKFCATFTAHNIDILHFVCTPRGQSHVPLFHRLFPFPTFDCCVFIFFQSCSQVQLHHSEGVLLIVNCITLRHYFWFPINA